MHAIVKGRRVPFELSKAQKDAVASADARTGELPATVSDPTASALIRKGLAMRRKFGKVILNGPGMNIRRQVLVN